MGACLLILALPFDELAVVQLITRLPVIGACSGWTKPVTKVGGEGVEVAAQTVGCGGRDAVRSESQFEIMHECKRIIFGSVTDVHGRDGFADRVEG